jgi:HD-like signal output (HDOD) protein
LDIRPAEAERVRVGHEHCVSVVLQAWQLPEPLVVATQFHHEPMLAPEPHRALAALVNVADHVARTSGMSFPCEAALGEGNPEAMALLELTPADLEAISATLTDSVASLQQSLN